MYYVAQGDLTISIFIVTYFSEEIKKEEYAENTVFLSGNML